jgi:hypothetical protein
MDIKNTLTKFGGHLGDIVKEPGFKVALITGGFGLATAIINNHSQKLAKETSANNLLTVKLQARMGGYDKELAEELLKNDTEEGKEEKTEETDKKEFKVVK